MNIERLTVVTPLLGLWLLASNSGCEPRRSVQTEKCQSDEDCDEAYCLQDVCVECYEHSHCSTHQECAQNVCAPLGASQTDQRLNAHGNWQGTPGQSDYHFIDTCTIDADCGVAEKCNPFTAGCILSADFQTACGPPPGYACDGTGPNGEVLACEKTVNLRCFPAPLCVDDHNCGGYEDFVCDAGQNVCQFIQTECARPTTVDSACPFAPKNYDECGTPFFCSALGQCVMCVCDEDCNGFSGMPRCDQTDGRCVSLDFCRNATDCPSGESCDRTNQVCKDYCASDVDCTGTRVFCDREDNVCRPMSEFVCTADALEPNQTAAEALSSGSALPVPGAGETVELPTAPEETLTLCDDDAVDWLAVPLETGEHLEIHGKSLTSLQADLTAFAPDGVSVVDTGYFSDLGSDLLSFTANWDATYFVRVSASAGATGTYRLVITASTETPCTDAFEDTHGLNNTIDEATPLNDGPGGPLLAPSPCDLIGGNEVHCTGGDVQLCEGDADFYLVDVPAGADLTVSLSGFGDDLDLFLYGPFVGGEPPTLDWVADGSDSQVNLTEQVVGVARQAASFVVQVKRKTGSATPYDLVLVVNAGPNCTEDYYDDASGATTPITGAADSSFPSTIDDPEGLNDQRTTASRVDVVHETNGEPKRIQSTETVGLNLCRGDRDWFRLGQNDGNVPPGLLDLVAGNRIHARLIDTVTGPTDQIFVGLTTNDQLPIVDPEQPQEVGTTLAGSGPYYLVVWGDPENQEVAEYTLEVSYTAQPDCPLDGLGDTASSTNDVIWPEDDAFLLDSADGWPGLAGEMGTQPDLSLCATDVDWYKFAVPAGTSLVSYVTGYDPRQAEVGLALFDASVLQSTNLDTPDLPDTGLLSSSELDGHGFQSVRATLPTTTTAYLILYNQTAWTLYPYTLKLFFLDPTCAEDRFDRPPLLPADENDIWQAAARVELAPLFFAPETDQGLLDRMTTCDSADHDWYAVDVKAGDQISANIYFNPSEGQLGLRLYQPGPVGLNQPVAHDDSILGDPTGIRTVHYALLPPPEPIGDYLVEVVPLGSGGNSNRYLLEVMVERSCLNDLREPSTQDAPSPILSALPFSENLVMCTEDDWYQLDLTSGQTIGVKVEFDSQGSTVDLDLGVCDQDNACSTRQTPGGTCDYLNYSASQDGPHLIRVFSTASVETTYTLTIMEGPVACP